MPKLPKFDDWTPPWGSDNEDIDAEKAAKFIHALLSDKDKLQGKLDAANETVTTVTAERDEARTELAAVNAKNSDQTISELQGKLTKAEGDRDSAASKLLRLEVALDKGVPVKQAHRLAGATKEELEADAEAFLADFGPAKGSEDGDDDGDDDGVPSSTPARLNTPVGRGREADVPLDIDKLIADIPRAGSF